MRVFSYILVLSLVLRLVVSDSLQREMVKDSEDVTFFRSLEDEVVSPRNYRNSHRNVVEAAPYPYFYALLFIGNGTVDGRLAPLNQRMAQAYFNMLEAVRPFGLSEDDIIYIKIFTTSIDRDLPLYKAYSKQLFGDESQFPAVCFYEVPSLRYGETLEIYGTFLLGSIDNVIASVAAEN